MDLLKEKLNQIFSVSGLSYSVEVDPEGNRVSIFFHDEGIVGQFLPRLLPDLELLVKAIARNLKIERVNVDVNNYKKERERIIAELAKAAARKAVMEKKDIELPAMNSYERRIVHTELAIRPDVKTESSGEGSKRHVVIKPI